MRAVFIFLCLACGAIVAEYAQPYMKDNTDAILVIITVMTVFAGFLVAIITVLGDPGMIPDGSWRLAENRRDNVEKRLYTHIYLFVTYLLAIAFLFISTLVNAKAADDAVSEAARIWIERLYLFFSTSGFLLTFALPIMLFKLQWARFNAEIARRRKADGIPPDTPTN